MTKRIILFLIVAAIAIGNLAGQNPRVEVYSGNDKVKTQISEQPVYKVYRDFTRKTEIIKQDRNVYRIYDDLLKKPVNASPDVQKQDGKGVRLPESYWEKTLRKDDVKLQEQNYKPSVNVRKSARDDVATVTLRVIGNPCEGHPVEDGTGFQMLIDADTDFGEIWQYNNNTFYNKSDYKIPQNASSNLSDPGIIFDGEGSVDIPEGIYDFAITHPVSFTILPAFWAKSLYGSVIALVNNFSFKAGYEYIFQIESSDIVDLYVDDDVIMLKEIILPPVSSNLTDQEDIKIVLVNNGINDITGEIELLFKINDGEVIEPEVFTINLSPGDEVTYTFNTKADFSEIGHYVVTTYARYDLDMNPLNNFKSGYTKKTILHELPFIEDFSNYNHDSRFLENWHILDFNINDIQTWLNLGDYVQITIPLNGDNAANDYLISDPILIPEADTYHITFEVFGDMPNSVRVLYGISPNPEEMEVLADYPDVLHGLYSEWSFKAIPSFEIESPDSYYFAFHYYTDAANKMSYLNLTNINIDRGELIFPPDIIFNNVITPLSSCGMSEAVIGAEVFNLNYGVINEFTLTYQVGNEEAVVQTFYETVNYRESVNVNFEQTVDFSKIGDYHIKFTAETPNEEIIDNNEIEITVRHFEPVTELPFISDFSIVDDSYDWNSTSYGGWEASSIGYECLKPNVLLVSRCIYLKPGIYRFYYEYYASFLMYKEDFFVMYGRSGTNPLTWEPVKEYYNVDAGYYEDFVIIEIKEEGEYAFAFMTVKYRFLLIYKTIIEVVEPLELPFIENFDTEEDFLTKWTVIDANEDGYTWEYNNDFPDADGKFGCLYIPTWFSDPLSDDYLISNPIIIQEEGLFNISFYFNPPYYMSYNRLIRVLYGTSSNPEEMELLDEYEIGLIWGWNIRIINFEIETPGNYFFVFHYLIDISDFNPMAGIYIDKIKIASGEFVGEPDISFSKVLVPVPSCEMGEEVLGVEVFNGGSAAISQFTLSYQVEDEAPVSQTFTEVIEMQESVTVYFDQKYDFSAMGVYNVKFSASTPNEVNTDNNEMEVIVNHFYPITELPFESDFSIEEDRADWIPSIEYSWFIRQDNFGSYYYSQGSSIYPLFSRCVTLVPGEYSFTFKYLAGREFFFTIFYEDFQISYGKLGTDPDTWVPVKEYFDIYTENEIIEDEITVNITEHGEYIFAFFHNNTSGGLGIFSTLLSYVVVIKDNTLSESQLIIYPNPTRGQLKIENGQLKIENIEIFDVFGRSVRANLRVHHDNTTITIDVSNLQAGLYFISVQTKDGIKNSKFVVK